MPRFSFWKRDVATHQPVLFEVAMRCSGPIVEFGCGEGSTRFLHELAEDRGLPLLTLDNNSSWLSRYRSLENDRHEFRHVTDWEQELASERWDQHWGLVFVDQSPWEARAATVARLRFAADWVVLHDCDYLARLGLVGRMIRDIEGPDQQGERDYSDAFSSWREFFPPEPWPYPPTGPPTLLGSNRFDCDVIPVSYHAHLPAWRRLIAKDSTHSRA